MNTCGSKTIVHEGKKNRVGISNYKSHRNSVSKDSHRRAQQEAVDRRMRIGASRTSGVISGSSFSRRFTKPTRDYNHQVNRHETVGPGMAPLNAKVGLS